MGVDRPAKNEILHHIPPTPEQEDFIQKPVSYTHLDVYKRQLYDLTTLQKEANAKHGFTAEQTLEIAQVFSSSTSP